MSELRQPAINLLNNRRHRYDKQVSTALKAKLYAGFVLVLYILLAMGVVFFDILLVGRNEDILSKINNKKLSIAAQAASEQRLTAVIAKAKAIDSILSKRRTLSALWKSILQLLPQGTKLTAFSVDGQELKVSITAPHVVKANQILDILEQNQLGFEVKKSDVSVNRGENAAYTLSVNMALQTVEKESSKSK